MSYVRFGLDSVAAAALVAAAAAVAVGAEAAYPVPRAQHWPSATAEALVQTSQSRVSMIFQFMMVLYSAVEARDQMGSPTFTCEAPCQEFIEVVPALPAELRGPRRCLQLCAGSHSMLMG